MKKDKEKAPDIFISEDTVGERDAGSGRGQGQSTLKKTVIIALMVLVFLGCLYMIFSPSNEEIVTEKAAAGLNQSVPQATESGLPSDKAKAYEQQLLKEKGELQQKGIATLADYWQQEQERDTSGIGASRQGTENVPGYQSYRSMRQSLGSFHEKADNTQLENEIALLKLQIANSKAKPSGADSQLAFIEKSYQLASKYFPGGAVRKDSTTTTAGVEASFVPLYKGTKNIVTSLRGPTAELLTRRSAGDTSRNSLKACVHSTQTVLPGQPVYLRLLERAVVSGYTIAEGSILTAFAKFDSGRLHLVVSSIESQGNILPVKLNVYDLDGQRGLYMPYTPEVNAVNQMASNMSATGGTSIMVTRSAGQQLAGDLSRGVVQGVSGYFSKKVKVPKVHLPAGYELLLLSQK